MKEVIILGTGGFASELVDYIYDNNKYSDEKINIVGFLDINNENYLKYSFNEPFLGSEDTYEIKDEYTYYLAIGNDKVRKNIIEKIKLKGIEFENFIHHSVILSRNTNIGKGNIFAPNVIIGPNTFIGDYNLFNYNTSIAHDCKVGNNNNFAPNVTITGYCEIVDDNLFGVSSGLTPNITVGNNNKVQAGLIINKTISDHNIVFSTVKINSMPIYRGKNG